MNKDNAKDYLPLVQALAEGKQIQINAGGWGAICEMRFDCPPEKYRIKPEPRIMYCVEWKNPDSEHWAQYAIYFKYNDTKAALETLARYNYIVRVTEFIEKQ